MRLHVKSRVRSPLRAQQRFVDGERDNARAGTRYGDTGVGAEGAYGPLFVLDDVRQFNAQRPQGLRATSEPQEIPGGYLVTFEDPSGNTIYVMDQSLDAAGSDAV